MASAMKKIQGKKENKAEKIDEKSPVRSKTLNMTVNEGLKNEVQLGGRLKVEKERNHLGSDDLSRQRRSRVRVETCRGYLKLKY